jgi:D-beta-D-heptose 7-phosphate kinase/D-beta-D-heptose 1-phosphate adenosyltransferase
MSPDAGTPELHDRHLALPRLAERFGALSVLVIGDAMLDSYLVGSGHRLCREAPVPIVAVTTRTDVPGGAANTAVNVAALGGRVRFLSVVGDDPEADRLRLELGRAGVATPDLIGEPGRRTLAKHRVSADGHMLVRFDQGSTERVSAICERRLVERLRASLDDTDAIVVSDYGYGVLTPRVLAALAELQARAPRVIVADSKNLAAYRGVGVTAIKPNYEEAVRLLGVRNGRGAERAALIAGRGERLLAATGARIAAVTLDTDGALFFERGRPAYRTYARPVSHSRAAGAGDTFVAALALALAAGAETPAAAELAAAAAAVVVAKDGTATCTNAELRAQVAGDAKITDLATLAARLDRHRGEGRRIVLTNGCFDLLHRGHVSYLSAAKAEGDVLVVAVNSDGSVRRLKGPSRPVNPVEDRAQVLAALSSVDYVVRFDEDTPVEVVRALRPHVFVKGGDYTPDMLPEGPLVEALGGTVRILPYLDDRSTSGIIERIALGRTA